MGIQQEINFRIRKEFDKLGIEFAFPTSTIYLEGTNGGSIIKKSSNTGTV
jgi:small-conductance mechanosensitive channel